MEKNNTYDLQGKYGLTIKEACKYFGIGEKKLRKMVAESPDAEWLFWNGAKTIIKRELFENFLNKANVI